MMNVSKLSSLHGVARIRKCAVLLERAEMNLARLDPERMAGAPDLVYARSVADFLAKDPESSDEVRRAAAAFLAAQPARPAAPSGRPGVDGRLNGAPARGEALRPLNDFRHFLMRVSGQAPADWDLHDYCSWGNGSSFPSVAALQSAGDGGEHCGPGQGTLARSGRAHSGRRVYLEDIRSPFNVGTIFRTAEALGFDEILLSPQCADPCHPHALRSSMGTVAMMPWRRCTIEEAAIFGPLFALELGGVSVYRFDFPASGTIVLGSEELGVSQMARALAFRDAKASCDAQDSQGGGIVSIPMRGTKASINVAVAFGIAASLWAETNSR